MDISNITDDSLIPLDILKPIRIVGCTPGSYVKVRTEDHDSGIYIEDIFYPDSNLEVSVDIKDFVSSLLDYDNSFISTLSESRPTVVHLQGDTIRTIVIIVTSSDSDNELAVHFNTTPHSAENLLSDIEQLEVPRDYVLAMSFPAGFTNSGGNAAIRVGSNLINIGIDNYPDEETDVATHMVVDVICRLKESGLDTEILEEATAIILKESEASDLPSSISSPKLVFSAKPFEQYLFRNSYGALDNIPMSGARKFVPEYSLETGTLGDDLAGTERKSVRTFSQDTGYLPRKTIAALSELLKSDGIWHLKDGAFRKIVITGTTLSLSSAETAHSASFTYRYAEESEPMKLI